MKVIKPQRLGLLTKVFEHQGHCYFVASILVLFPFDAPSALLPEVNLWQLVARELGQDTPLDLGMPKPRPEVLVTGRAFTPGGKPQIGCAARLKLASVDKTLHVIGDRVWQRGGPSAPEPFIEMPISYEKAFGGAGYAKNPLGKGFGAIPGKGGGAVQPLPNIEDPRQPIRSPDDRPEPAGFGPYDLTWPQRFQKAGTYDQRWRAERFPGLADDADFGLWSAAPPDQQVERFRLDEAFSLENMHPTRPLLTSRLPGIKVRGFIRQKTAAGEELRELTTHLDTVHLIPHEARGILIYRALARIAEDDAADVTQILIGAEVTSAPRSAEHYRAVLSARLDKQKGALLALRDADLMPEDTLALIRQEAQAPDEMDALVATEGLLQKNLRRKMELELEEARARVTSLGLDPAAYVPAMPPEEPAPDLDRLPELFDQITAQVEQARAEVSQRMAQAEEDARKACAEAGLDYEQVTREARERSGGPPSFSAEKELARLEELAPLDPTVKQKLLQAERQLRDAYKRFAHHFPAAASLQGDAAARLREEVIVAHRAGQSLEGRDFTGADLSRLDLTGIDLRGALLEGASFAHAILAEANLEGAVLARADLSAANLEGARLASVNLGRAKLAGAKLTGGVDLTAATLAYADLSGASLRGARMDGVDLLEARFADTDFRDVTASGLSFVGADLTGLSLVGAALTRCNFVEVNVTAVDFSGATLTASVFVSAKGDGARFRGSRLDNLRVVQGSSFAGADFVGACLDGANLRGTNLEGSDLSGASLDGADLSACDLKRAKLYRASAKGALFIRADLSEATLVSANLMQSILQKANLSSADLRDANLFRADLAKVQGDSGTKLDGALVTQVRFVARRPHETG